MNILYTAIVLSVLAVGVVMYRLYEYNRDVKKCNTIAEKADKVMNTEQWLEAETGFKVTRIVHGESRDWKWVHVEFTFLYNGYVTKSAVAKAGVYATKPSWELKFKVAMNMKAAAAAVKLDWWY